MARDTSLKLARMHLGLMSKDVAELLGISDQYYCEIENGRMPSFRLAMRIADLLSIPVQDLFYPKDINESLIENEASEEVKSSA